MVITHVGSMAFRQFYIPTFAKNQQNYKTREQENTRKKKKQRESIKT